MKQNRKPDDASQPVQENPAPTTPDKDENDTLSVLATNHYRVDAPLDERTIGNGDIDAASGPNGITSKRGDPRPVENWNTPSPGGRAKVLIGLVVLVFVLVIGVMIGMTLMATPPSTGQGGNGPYEILQRRVDEAFTSVPDRTTPPQSTSGALPAQSGSREQDQSPEQQQMDQMEEQQDLMQQREEILQEQREQVPSVLPEDPPTPVPLGNTVR